MGSCAKSVDLDLADSPLSNLVFTRFALTSHAGINLVVNQKGSVLLGAKLNASVGPGRRSDDGLFFLPFLLAAEPEPFLMRSPVLRQPKKV
ncbi:hypothetical protein SAMN04487996_14017 [Dyadobacter soli]|uniref:Uncharacterized protein n=1 Tax=Dyadobacter soli TaxID=659014 RepID=A0A1G8CVA0_9BACT|nr:hypothetical protein SAMN04487996_14017 [Dyadobacter soli]